MKLYQMLYCLCLISVVTSSLVLTSIADSYNSGTNQFNAVVSFMLQNSGTATTVELAEGLREKFRPMQIAFRKALQESKKLDEPQPTIDVNNMNSEQRIIQEQIDQLNKTVIAKRTMVIAADQYIPSAGLLVTTNEQTVRKWEERLKEVLVKCPLPFESYPYLPHLGRSRQDIINDCHVQLKTVNGSLIRSRNLHNMASQDRVRVENQRNKNNQVLEAARQELTVAEAQLKERQNALKPVDQKLKQVTGAKTAIDALTQGLTTVDDSLIGVKVDDGTLKQFIGSFSQLSLQALSDALDQAGNAMQLLNAPVEGKPLRITDQQQIIVNENLVKLAQVLPSFN